MGEATRIFNLSDDYRVAVSPDDFTGRLIDDMGEDVEIMVFENHGCVDMSRNTEDMMMIAGAAHMDVGCGLDCVIAAFDRHYDRKDWGHSFITLIGSDPGTSCRLYIAINRACVADIGVFVESFLRPWFAGETHVFESQHRREVETLNGDILYTWDAKDSVDDVRCDMNNSDVMSQCKHLFDMSDCIY